ncbi:MAG: PLP-dependent aminotransferase family protein [Colwellia sp.]|nr:PLP-dependent aminotransferase family protein [Colwellia sp.]MCW8865145.1 PLP-dependent aminotransferase family protein [Colwellia sp.]MCW9082494.1 PLP-dependent aminotransferase family protein [Colwellia sp.]
MKTLNLIIEDHQEKLYLKIANAIRKAIESGTVTPAEQLPSARSLAEQLAVNRHTIMAAYNELIAQGWVETKQRQGYWVAQVLPIYCSLENKVKQQGNTNKHNWRVIKSNQEEFSRPANDYAFNFAGGNPDIELFPFNEFRGFINEALNRPAIKELNYGENSGYSEFINQVSTYLRRVRSIKDKEIIVVNGSQEALYILSQVLIKAGDKVAVENLGYRPAWAALRNAGAELMGINQTEQGIDVDEFEYLIQQHNIKLLYLTPLHQYPTTTTLSTEKRVKIYQLAQQYNIPIIEDDYDHEYHYNSQPLPPMAANDPSGLVIYLSSFSKIMFPGIRLGIVAVDKELAPHIVSYRTLMNHKANVLQQDAISRWMKDGGFERHLRKSTRRYQKRRECMVAVLNSFINDGIKIKFTNPKGGMALWIDVGQQAMEIAELAKSKGIFLLAENAFHLHQENNENRFIRLGFAGQSEEKIKQGLMLLKPLLIHCNR